MDKITESDKDGDMRCYYSDDDSVTYMRNNRREAMMILFSVIKTMIVRVYFIVVSEIPDYEDFQAQSELSESIELFHE